MSNWKILLNQTNSEHDRSVISNRSKGKYTPRRSKQDNLKSPSRFNNLSISKIQDSVLSADQNSAEEKARLKSYNLLQSRLKNCASELQLRKALNRSNKEEDPLHAANLSEIHRPTKKESSQILPTNLVYEREIMKLKKEFAEFQQIIFRELEKQEKMLNYMINQIINRIKAGTLQATTKSDILKPQSRNFSPQFSEIHNIKESFTNRPNKIQQMLESNVILRIKPEPDLKKKSTVSFGKFFEAVDNLKKDIQDLTEVGSAWTPKSVKHKNLNLNWEEVVSRLKTED